MDVWITPETLSEKMLSFVTSPTGLVVTITLLLSVIGGCAYAVGRFSHKRKLKDAYEAYDLKPEKFTLSTEFLDYELPSAPDLSALMGQQSAPVVLPSVPIVEDEDGIPRAPELD